MTVDTLTGNSPWVNSVARAFIQSASAEDFLEARLGRGGGSMQNTLVPCGVVMLSNSRIDEDDARYLLVREGAWDDRVRDKFFRVDSLWREHMLADYAASLAPAVRFEVRRNGLGRRVFGLRETCGV